MSEIDKNILRDIEQQVGELLGLMVLDKKFNFRVSAAIETTDESIYFNHTYNTIRLVIETNNLKLIKGQLVDFEEDRPHGYYNFYYSGFLEGFLKSKYGDAYLANYVVAIDFVETNDSYEQLWKYVRLEDAIAQGILESDSYLATIMDKYELMYLLIGGSSISGPSVDMITYIEYMLKQDKMNRVLDLFSGTGALAKVCIANGVDYVACYEANCEVIKETLGPYNQQCDIFETNIFDVKNDSHYDLAIIDSFYDHALEVAKYMIPKLAKKADRILFNVSDKDYESWYNRIQEEVSKTLDINNVFRGRTAILLDATVRTK